MSDFLKTIGTLSVLDKVGEQGRTIDRQGRALDDMSDALRDAKDDVSRAKAGAEFQRNRANELEALLSKPMSEIAAKNGRFRETYDKQQEMLASWIVSQCAFKELAMKYGALAGKTREEINAESDAAEKAILDDQSQFGNKVNEETKVAVKRKKAREEKQAQAAQNKASHSA